MCLHVVVRDEEYEADSQQCRTRLDLPKAAAGRIEVTTQQRSHPIGTVKL